MCNVIVKGARVSDPTLAISHNFRVHRAINPLKTLTLNIVRDKRQLNGSGARSNYKILGNLWTGYFHRFYRDNDES